MTINRNTLRLALLLAAASAWACGDEADPEEMDGIGGAFSMGEGGTGQSGGGQSGVGGGSLGGGGGAPGAGAAGTGGAAGAATGGASSGGRGGTSAGGAPAAGGRGGGAVGGRGGGTGGAAQGGAAGQGTGGAAAAGCRVVRPDASGMEPGGQIPVCCAPAAADKAFVDEVFKLLNEHRAANGRSPLAYDEKLGEAAQGHSQHMATHVFFSHTAPEADVSSPTMRASLCGTSASGENIAYNQRTPAQVMTTWKNSSGHNANMLNSGYKRVGIGFYQYRWTQIFGR